MTKTYTPRAGSLSEKVIKHLSDGATQISSAEMETMFGANRSGISNQLNAPRKFGLLVLHRNGRKALYTLPGVAPHWDGQPTKPKTTTTPRAQREVVAPAPANAPVAIASLWDDGDVVLWGITAGEDGNSCTLSDLQARQVHRFLERVYGPNV